MTGLQITIPGADFSRSGIPRNTRYVAGTKLPLAGALGIYLLEDGTVDQQQAGFANLLAGPSAVVMPGWSLPTMKAFGSKRGGLRVDNVNGTLIDTRISAQRSQFTVAMLVNTHPKRGTQSPYNLVHLTTSDTVNAIPATNTGTLQMLSNTTAWGIGASMSTGKVGQFMRYGAPITPGTALYTDMATTVGVAGQWNAFAIAVDGPAGIARFQSLTDRREMSDATEGDTEIRKAFVTDLAERNGNFLFGGAVNGPSRDTNGPLVDLMAVAVYGQAYTATGMDVILRGLGAIAAERGVAVEGY